MLNTLIEEFGKRMQIDELSLDEQGIVSLDIDNMGTLQLEYDSDSDKLFVCFAREFAAYEQDMAQKVLELCSFSNGPSVWLQGGIKNNMVVLATKVDYHTKSSQDLENIVRILVEKISQLF